LTKRFLVYVAVAAAGTIGYAQTKVTNLDEYRTAMRTIGGGVGGAAKAMQSGAMADAKTGIGNAKTAMMAVETFFKDKGKSDLEMMAKDAVEKLGALETALGGTDMAAAGGGVQGRARHLRCLPQQVSRSGPLDQGV
jgi:hypothetical protein